MSSPDARPQDDAPSVQSVDRAVRLLRLLAADEELRVGDLARGLDVHKSTASRLLTTLERHGLVQQQGERGAYRLGYGLLELAGALPGTRDLLGAGRAVAVDLAAEVDETVNLAVLDGPWTVCVDQVLGSSSVTSVNWTGTRNAAHATASGKAILAQLPWDEVVQLLPEPLEQHAARTIVDHAGLRASLDRVRRRGWSQSIDEQEDGLASVAAVVTDAAGRAMGALAVSGPSFRLTLDRLPTLGAAAARAAARVSERTLAPGPVGDGGDAGARPGSAARRATD